MTQQHIPTYIPSFTDSALIGIAPDNLHDLILHAYRSGFEAGHRDLAAMHQQQQWLNSRDEIIHFLSASHPITPQTFNRNRRLGMYGNAIIGRGERCKARIDDLQNAIKLYQSMKI